MRTKIAVNAHIIDDKFNKSNNIKWGKYSIIKWHQNVTYFTWTDIPAAFDTMHHDKLHEIAVAVLSEDRARMLRVQLTDTTRWIKSKDTITILFTSSIGASQWDNYSWPQFEPYFVNSLKIAGL